jgi:hypothetical protein
VAPQTASVVVSTTQFVRNVGAVIRQDMGCTFVLGLYLVLIGWLPTCTSWGSLAAALPLSDGSRDPDGAWK